jgi:YYY domain-containing protein
MDLPVLVQIEAVILLLAILLCIQIATMLISRPFLGALAAPLAFPLSLLITAMFVIWIVWVSLPPIMVILPFLATLVVYFYREGRSCMLFIREHLMIYALWLLSFVFMTGIAASTLILGTSENITDFAILMSAWHHPAVPIQDPWLGGMAMDMYYYLGHLLFATISLASGLSPDLIFTLAVPTIFAATLLGIYAVSSLLLERYRYLPILAVLLPNLGFALALFSGSNLMASLQMSIRVIAETNNEYPYYSFVMSVIHAHVFSLFNQVVLITILAYLLLTWKSLQVQHRVILAGIAALSFGAMFPLNTWDVAVYGPGLFLAGAWLYLASNQDSPLPNINGSGIRGRVRSLLTSRPAPLVFFWIGIPLLSLIWYLPYHLTQHTVPYALSPCTTSSDPVQFLVLFGPLLLVLLIILRTTIRSFPYLLAIPVLLWIPGYGVAGLILMFLLYFLIRRQDITDYLAIIGLWALLIVEFLVYGDRFNTVFKFHYSAGLLLGLVVWISIARWLGTGQVSLLRHPQVESSIQILCIGGALLVAAGIALSVGHAPTLDAVSPLLPHLGGDADAVMFLRSLPGDHILIELSNPEVGGYHPYGRISALSGVPSVIGWWKHEMQWRLIDPQVMEKLVKDNNAVYQDPDAVLRKMDDLGADLLYVGTLEKKTYSSIKLPEEGLELIYQQNGVYIFRRLSD